MFYSNIRQKNKTGIFTQLRITWLLMRQLFKLCVESVMCLKYNLKNFNKNI